MVFSMCAVYASTYLVDVLHMIKIIIKTEKLKSLKSVYTIQNHID